MIPREGSRRAFFAGAGLWLLALLVVSVMVVRDPSRRSVTPVFHLAAERWAARSDLYADPRGFHYLPQFALLFAPFHALPVPIGDLLWRIVSVGLVLWGLAAFLDRLAADEPGRRFLIAAALALAPCLGSMRNGQTNLAFGGLVLLLAANLASSRWIAASACLVALVALKPLGLVFVLLAPWFYRRLLVPVGAGLALLAALPFLFAPQAYAAAEYRAAWAHLASWSGTTESRFADLSALLRMAGVGLSPASSLALRAAAAAATLGLWLRAASRSREPLRALTLALLAGSYLMLFNPMTEKNSYAIVAPAYGVAAAILLDRPASRRAGAFLGLVLVSVGVLPEILWRVSRDFGLWWDPLTAAAVAAALAVAILRRGDPFAFEAAA